MEQYYAENFEHEQGSLVDSAGNAIFVPEGATMEERRALFLQLNMPGHGQLHSSIASMFSRQSADSQSSELGRLELQQQSAGEVDNSTQPCGLPQRDSDEQDTAPSVSPIPGNDGTTNDDASARDQSPCLQHEAGGLQSGNELGQLTSAPVKRGHAELPESGESHDGKQSDGDQAPAVRMHYRSRSHKRKTRRGARGGASRGRALPAANKPTALPRLLTTAKPSKQAFQQTPQMMTLDLDADVEVAHSPTVAEVCWSAERAVFSLESQKRKVLHVRQGEDSSDEEHPTACTDELRIYDGGLEVTFKSLACMCGRKSCQACTSHAVQGALEHQHNLLA